MRRGGLLLLAVVATLLGAGWVAYDRYLGAPVVRLASPRWGPLVEGVYGTGVVEPVNWAKVRPLVAGRLLSFHAREGQSVAAGDLLARVEDEKARARLTEVDSRLRYLDTERARIAELVRGSIASRKNLELIESELAQARALRIIAREQVEDARVVAPIAGVILRREGRVGELVDPATVLFWIGLPMPREVVAEIDEEYVPRVRLDQTVLIRSDAFGGRFFVGRVGEMTPFGDATQRSFRLKVALDDGLELPLGMTVEVNVVVREAARALLVPASAVASGRVWAVEGGRAVSRPVAIGLRGTDEVEIREGLAETDRVVVDPPERLRAGMRVRIGRPRPAP
ncbi:MAG: efflux RND transporter periplasmic adaptor subunit [Alphaproteobacteria bacterium]